MILTHRLQAAINEASRLHRDQLRKDKQQTPYITHLIGVMILVSSVTHDEDILIAALMHDALEDIPEYTPEQLATTFGTRVRDIVLGVTEESKLLNRHGGSWKEEKQSYLDNLKHASDDSLLVSLADKIQNTRGYIEMLNIEGLGMLAHFGSGNEERIWFHDEVLTIGNKRLGEDHLLVEELRVELEELKKLVNILGTTA